MATKKQIQIIHIAKQQLGLDEEIYRNILRQYGVKSSKELSNAQALHLIKYFQEAGFKIKVKYREGMITPRQIGYLKYLWQSNPAVRNKSVEGLEHFIKRIIKIDRLEWIPRHQVQEVIQAIRHIR